MNNNSDSKKAVFLPPIKRYVNAVERRLRLPWKLRARVMSDFSTSLSARHEAGESWEEIMQSLGTPEDVAAQLNEQMEEYTYRKSPWRFAFLVPAILALIQLVPELIWTAWINGVLNSGVIGGADGPTAVYVTGISMIGDNRWVFQLVLAAIAAVGLFGFWKLSRCKSGREKKD